MSPMTKATVFVTPPRLRSRASVFGRKRSCRADSSTFSRVPDDTFDDPENTRDPVLALTPDSLATSSSRALTRGPVSLLASMSTSELQPCRWHPINHRGKGQCGDALRKSDHTEHAPRGSPECPRD